MKIVVCIKQVPATGADKRYTADLRLDRAAAESIINPLDEYAIEQALRLVDDGTVDHVTYLSMGPEQASEALRRALAMGGDDALLVSDAALSGADEWATAKVLAAALDKLAPDVALMGMASDHSPGYSLSGLPNMSSNIQDHSTASTWSSIVPMDSVFSSGCQSICSTLRPSNCAFRSARTSFICAT